MKQQTQFESFYGFNTYPKIFTAGTFVENIKNRTSINFSTHEDYYYQPNANDDLAKLINVINADYNDYRYNELPNHWFPRFDESEPAYQIFFYDLITRKRNPLIVLYDSLLFIISTMLIIFDHHFLFASLSIDMHLIYFYQIARIMKAQKSGKVWKNSPFE
ncbi:hypothetical protein QE382_002879 [Sphingobacterium zeae]|uniref:Uncharacterized protein n=1 Tax=Sphingobacterium zeae TaxID=1776859 RepID=A0ABU0U7J4_9SPHI|nr:hypothetical protein [Sphingobacterium zeae]